MKMRRFDASDEYLDSLCEWMLEFAEKEDSLIIPQFLALKGIGYPFLKYFVSVSPKVANSFEIMKSKLCNRWLSKGLTMDNLSPHMAKVMIKYIRLYDSHGFDLEQEARQQIAVAEKTAEVKTIIAENYQDAKLDAKYETLYIDNTRKEQIVQKA